MPSRLQAQIGVISHQFQTLPVLYQREPKRDTTDRPHFRVDIRWPSLDDVSPDDQLWILLLANEIEKEYRDETSTRPCSLDDIQGVAWVGLERIFDDPRLNERQRRAFAKWLDGSQPYIRIRPSAHTPELSPPLHRPPVSPERRVPVRSVAVVDLEVTVGPNAPLYEWEVETLTKAGYTLDAFGIIYDA